jgi:hypothetical protein
MDFSMGLNNISNSVQILGPGTNTSDFSTWGKGSYTLSAVTPFH